MAPNQPLPLSFNPPMRAHLRSLFRHPLPSPTRELFASYVEDLAPPSESDTGIPLDTHPSYKTTGQGGGEGIVEDFVEFMRGNNGTAETPLGLEARDMGYPLSSYFVNSSHNTYLTGNQLYGESSGGAYRDVGRLSLHLTSVLKEGLVEFQGLTGGRRKSKRIHIDWRLMEPKG